MPDARRHRGRHPDDDKLFSVPAIKPMRSAVADLAWLLSHAYAPESALKLVGDRYNLTARQRDAVRRCTCSDSRAAGRKARRVPLRSCAGRAVGVDGYNLLITVEAALSGGIVLVGVDGAFRDLSSVHGTYRRVEETVPALTLIAEALESARVRHVDWYLDKPVSNSGRLKAILADLIEQRASPLTWNIELADSPDAVLGRYDGIVASSDSEVLDACDRWVNLAGEIVRKRVDQPWIVNLAPRA